MNERTRLAWRVLAAAAALGILGDALLQQTPWGLNMALWTGALAMALLILALYPSSLTGISRLRTLTEAILTGTILGAALLLGLVGDLWLLVDTPQNMYIVLRVAALGIAILIFPLRRLLQIGMRRLSKPARVIPAGALLGPALTVGLTGALLGTALALAVMGDGLLAVMWYVPLPLWIGPLAIAIMTVALVLALRPSSLTGVGRLWLCVALLSALALTWRDSPVLRALDLGALLTALGLAALNAQEAWTSRAGVVEGMGAVLLALFCSAFGSIPLFKIEIPWRGLLNERRFPHVIAVGRGLLIALPLLLVFGALFFSADAVFEKFVHTVSDIDTTTLSQHLWVIALCSCLTAGFLYEALPALKQRRDRSTPTPLSLPTLGRIEIGIVLGLLDLLFLGFVLIQLRYLFGGAAHVQATLGLTYAEYARHGFFELVIVAVLSLPILLCGHGLLPKEDVGIGRLFRALAGILILLVFVILASAMQRMRLYQSEYGLTQLRFYTQAFMGWLAVVFLWFAVTVLRDRREYFASGALAAAFLTIFTLHAVNPDACIIHANVAHAAEGGGFDAAYAMSLSTDAIPALLEIPQELKGTAYYAAWGEQFTRLNRPPDWRTWSWSREVAREAAEDSPNG